MRTSLRMALLILIIAVLPVVARAQVKGVGVSPGTLMSGPSGIKTLDLQVKDQPVMEVLNSLAKAGNISFVVRGELPKSTVTVNLAGASARSAFEAICAAAGLQCTFAPGGVFIVSPGPTATVGGAQVPVLGAWSVGGETPEDIRQRIRALAQTLAAKGNGAQPDPEKLRELVAQLVPLNFRAGLYGSSSGTITLPGVYGSNSGTMTLPGVLTHNASFAGAATLVDLVGQDLSLREAMEQLSRSSGVSIMVDKSVPEGIGVTANIHRLPLGQTLSMLVGQAHLIYVVDETKDDKLEIHIVPPPELRVDTSRVLPGGGELVPDVPVVWRAMPDPNNRGERGKWYSISFDDRAWPTVSTAHMWCVQEGPLKNLRGSYAWGRVKFSVDPKWRGRPIVLRIVALDEQGTVYLNGEEIARSGGIAAEGRKPLDIEVTGKLRFGQSNVLAVRAYAKSTVGGVYRPVVLYAPRSQ